MPLWIAILPRHAPFLSSRARSILYSVVLPSKCSLSATASARVWWTTPSPVFSNPADDLPAELQTLRSPRLRAQHEEGEGKHDD
jgi:hypothetical protein